MKKIDRLKNRANSFKHVRNLWLKLIQYREELHEAKLNNVIVMFDVALEALIMELERIDRESKKEKIKTNVRS